MDSYRAIGLDLCRIVVAAQQREAAQRNRRRRIEMLCEHLDAALERNLTPDEYAMVWDEIYQRLGETTAIVVEKRCERI